MRKPVGHVIGMLLALGWTAPERMEAGVNRWTPIGPDGGVITALAVGPDSNPVVYAGTLAGLFRSSDAGRHWIPSNQGLPGVEITSLAVDPRTPSTVYAAAGGIVYKSTDAGARWASRPGAFAAIQLAIDPSESSILYVTSGRKIFRSTDGAGSWKSVYAAESSSPVSRVNTVAVARGRVYAGFETRRCLIFDFCVPSGGGVLRSTDGSGDWQVAGEIMPIRALAVDPGNDDTLYAGGGGVFPSGSGALLRSTDGGAHWSAIGPRGEVVSVAIDPRDSAVVYFGIHDIGVFRWDGGVMSRLVWTASLWVSVAAEPSSGRIWAGSYDGVATSANGSDGWEVRSRGIAGTDLRSIALGPDGSTLYAGTYGGVYKSTDGGATWVRNTLGLADRVVQVLRIDPSNPETLYAGTYTGVYRSTDAGETWVPTGLSAVFIADVAVDPRSPSNLYAMAPEAGVFRSTDAGRSWSAANAGLTNTQGYALDIDPVTSAVYAGTVGGVYRSTDGGSSWTTTSGAVTGVNDVRVAPSDGSTLYASTGSGLFKTTDGGLSWSPLGQYGASIAIDPLDPSTVYTASFGEVARSTDGGVTWKTAPGLPALAVVSLAVRPGTGDAPSRVYAATSGGGAFAISFQELEACVPDATTLCLQDGRFRVTVDWRTAKGRSGVGQAVPLSEESAAFWFRTPDDVELAVKVLDGRSMNGNFWFFAGALSSVEYTIHVVDTFTGAVKTYFNPLGRLESFVDTSAFASDGATSGAVDRMMGVPAPIAASPDPADCGEAPHALCLKGSRFRVAVAWKTRNGRTGEGQAVPLSSEAGYFWFFDPKNVELVVKVLDGRPINGHFWVFYGALSTVAYTITVTDTQTGAVRTYENALGNQASVGDTEAF